MSALVTRFDVLVGVAFGVAAVAVAGLVLLLVAAAGRTDARDRRSDDAHVIGSQLDVLEAMLAAGDDPRPRYVREVHPAFDPPPYIPAAALQREDPLAWLDGLLADAGVTPDMTPQHAAERIDEVLVDLTGPAARPDADRTLEQIDAALAAVADSVGVERTGAAVRLLCDPLDPAGTCALHGDGLACRYGPTKCCPTCPTP